MTQVPLKSPFPYFGGKSKIAPVVWDRFGRVDNFVDPCFGSGAVLFACPWPGHTETVNDADGLLCNFFRALQSDPDAVAYHADFPVMELDLHSRHRWLVNARPEIERLLADPDYYDAKAAGWWVWGISQWIGSGWCDGSLSKKKPSVGAMKTFGTFSGGDGSKGVHAASFGQLPHVVHAGRGVHRALHGQLPMLKPGANGVHRDAVSAGLSPALSDYLRALAARLRRVRVCCGDFERVLGPSVTWRHGTTAVFLDPPYDRSDRADVYAVEGGHDVAERARQWAIANGDNPLLRIALCGYDIEMPDGWQVYRWKASGGYGSQAKGRGRENAARECVWFSPHCIYETPLELWAREQDA